MVDAARNISESLDALLARAKENPHALARDDLAHLLTLTREDDLARLFRAARDVKRRACGRGIALRGLIEIGNVCAKDCRYCGIRRSNTSLVRYTLALHEIFETARLAKERGAASLVLQSGELESEAHTRWIETILTRLQPLDMGITLSLGEQTPDVYARWFRAGATRYLLRIETSDRDFYATLHPSSCSWSRRVDCLRALHEIGYQVGTGVMCGLPHQTHDMLARDIEFFGAMNVDMIGMGPYIPHPNAPLEGPLAPANEHFLLGLKMIAATRLYLHDVNIAAATALEALATDGRDRGIAAGANVIMPNMTATRWREAYQLYEGKPTRDESSRRAREERDAHLAALDEEILYNQRGDSRHYASRMKEIKP